MTSLSPGTVAWAWLDPVVGKDQAGRRPVVVISSTEYADIVTDLVIVMPLTRIDRGWDNHVPLTGVPELPASFVMTEQPRTVSRDRLKGTIGAADASCVAQLRLWIDRFLTL